MYAELFGLKEAPFNSTSDSHYFFASPQHDEAVASVVYAVQERKGLVMVTADVGMGKTIVGHMLVDQLGMDASVASLSSAHIRDRGLLATLCREFQIPTDDRAATMELLAVIEEFLLAEQTKKRLAVLVLDDAHGMSDQQFEQLRLLANLEVAGGKLLQIVLLGQHALSTIVHKPAFRQLRQRVFREFHISRFSRDISERYIKHRLEVAGADGDRIFESDALDLIQQYTSGIPRLINNLCDNVLLSAYSDDVTFVDRQRVSAVIDEITAPSGSPDAAEPCTSNDTDHAIAEITNRYVQSLEQQLAELDETQAESDRRIHELNRLSAKLQSQEFKLQEHQGVIDRKVRELHRLTITLQEQENHLSQREKLLGARQESLQNLSQRLDDQEKKLAEREVRTQQQIRELERMSSQIAEQDQKLAERATFIDKKLSSRQVSFDRELNECKNAVNRKWQEMKNLVGTFESKELDRDRRQASVDKRLQHLDKIITDLGQKEKQLQACQEKVDLTMRDGDKLVQQLTDGAERLQHTLDRGLTQTQERMQASLEQLKSEGERLQSYLQEQVDAAQQKCQHVGTALDASIENADALLAKPELILDQASKQVAQVERMVRIVQKSTDHLECTIKQSLAASDRLSSTLARVKDDEEEAQETIQELEAISGKTHRLREVLKDIFERCEAQKGALRGLVGEAERAAAVLPKQLDELKENTAHPAKLMKELRSVGSITERHLHDGQLRLSELRLMIDQADTARRSIEALVSATRRVADRRPGGVRPGSPPPAPPSTLNKKIENLSEAVRKARSDTESVGTQG